MPRVVYRAYPGAHLQRVLGVLRRHGLTPFVLDNPDPHPLMRYAAKGTYSIRVAVRDEEYETAAAAIRAWIEKDAPDVKRHARAFHRQLLMAAGFAGLVALAAWLGWGGGADVVLGFLFVAALGGLALWGNLRGVLGRRRFPAGHCRKCGYDLTGNVSGRCPECGMRRGRRRRRGNT